MKRYRNFKRGFTFLEIIAAIAILSAALIPILTWVPTSLQTKIKTERKTTAIFLAQAKIEELRNNIIKDFDQNYNSASVSFNAPYQGYRYTATDDLVAGFKTISVKAWHIENPNDETAFYTQIAQR